eukprot:137222_1
MSHCIFLLLFLQKLILTINGKTMDIDCTSKESCSKTIRCVDNEDCIVNCESCAGSTIYCPMTPNHCTVICSTKDSCAGTLIDATFFNSNLQKYALDDSIVKCPVDQGQCSIHCENAHSCQQTTIDRRATSPTYNISLMAKETQAMYNDSNNAGYVSYGTLDIYCNTDETCQETYPIEATTTATRAPLLSVKGIVNILCNQTTWLVLIIYYYFVMYLAFLVFFFDFLLTNTYLKGCIMYVYTTVDYYLSKLYY